MADTPAKKGTPPEAANHLRGHRWKKGESGNPSGRPRGRLVTDAVERLLYQRIPSDHALVRQVPALKNKTWAEALAYGLVLAGVKGETPAAREIMDRTEGPVLRTDAGPVGPTVNVAIVDDDVLLRVAEIFVQRRRGLLAPPAATIETTTAEPEPAADEPPEDEP